jgi:hypothetical protein
MARTVVNWLAYAVLALLMLSALYAGYAFHSGDEAARVWIFPLCMLTAGAAILIGNLRRRNHRQERPH